MVVSGFPNDPFTQALAERLVDEVFRLAHEWVPKGVSEIKKRWPKHPPALFESRGLQIRRVGLVNRERELRAIRAALADANRSHLLYFCGPGGVGKTRLLEETPRLIKGVRLSSPLRWAGIIDLYHVEYHSISAIQMAIINALDPQGCFFEEYRLARQQFEHHKEVGLRDELGTDLVRLDDAFQEGYREFTRTCRPVLAFDTFEKVNGESDLAQRLFGDQAFSLEQWLVDFWQTAPNSVFLVAGRPPAPPPSQRPHHSGNSVERIEVGGFTREDSRRLLASFLQKRARPMQNLLKNADALWRVTGGSPVWLALVVELLVHSGVLLEHLQDEAEESNKSRLVSALFDDEASENRPVFLLALARKGLTADLLHYLEPPWTLEECRRRLDSLRSLSLVKSHSGREELFLHDALYEVFDQYISQTLNLRSWYEIFVDYYRGQQAACQSDRAAWGDAAVKLLYYALQYDPGRAFYEYYIRWSEAAIAGYEIDLDLQLREELLPFLRAGEKRSSARTLDLDSDVVNLDGVVRWVKRYTFQSYHSKAAELAESILLLGPRPYRKWIKFQPEMYLKVSAADREQIQTLLARADDLFWGHLLTYYGDVLTYLAGTPEERISFFLEKAREHLERSAPPPSLTWLKARLLGRVYDRFGYLARTYGHYGRAVECYQQALPYLEESESLEELATTLNNLSFVLAFLGETEQAREWADKAFRYRQQLGQRYPLALSHNTRGLIYASENQEQAIRECQRALEIFEEINASRGIGLACNALGYILCRQGVGKSETRNFSAAEQYFQQSEMFLKRGVEIFKGIVEPIRLWEAYNEWGNLYFEWGNCLQEQRNKKQAIAQWNVALEKQNEALSVARQNFLWLQEAETAEDISRVYACLNQPNEAEVWLHKLRKLIPDEYDFTKRSRKPKPPKGELYWLTMGKFWLRRGEWILQFASTGLLRRRRESLHCFLLAEASYHAYSSAYAVSNSVEIRRHLQQFEALEIQQAVAELAQKYGIKIESWRGGK